MNSPIRLTWALLLASALSLATASCSSAPVGGDNAAQPADETQPAVQVDEAAADETDADQAGAEDAGQAGAEVPVEELEGELVSSFPAEVPLYDGEIESSLSGVAEISGNPEWNVAMTTADSLDAVDTAIREAFSSNGWAIGTDMEFAGGYQLTARSSEHMVSITYNDFGGPLVMINYGVSAL